MNVVEARKKWLEVMRLPQSQRHKEYLENAKNPNARCCLGHGCHALGIERRVDDGNVIYGKASIGTMPDQAAMLLDIDSEGAFVNPVIVDESRVTVHRGTQLYDDGTVGFGSMITLNDYTNLSLSELADIIERELANGNVRRYGA